MKYLAILTPMLLLACEMDIEYEYSIDPRLNTHVESFYNEANARGISLHRNLIVRIETIEEEGGQAFSRGRQQIVLVHPNTYDFLASGKWVKGDSAHYGLENLVYHELGHAMLRRDHCDPCFSIMSRGMSLFEYAKHRQMRERLVDELFNLTKPQNENQHPVL